MAVERVIEHQVDGKWIDIPIHDSLQVGDRVQIGPYFFDVEDRETLRKVKEGSMEGIELRDERAVEKASEPLDDARQEQIALALSRLDPENDDHWTKGGLPDLQTLRDMMGNVYVKREEIPPGFTRY